MNHSPQDHDPLGYLLLQNTVIYIRCNTNDPDVFLHQEEQLLGKWHNVSIVPFPSNNNKDVVLNQNNSESIIHQTQQSSVVLPSSSLSSCSSCNPTSLVSPDDDVDDDVTESFEEKTGFSKAMIHNSSSLQHGHHHSSQRPSSRDFVILNYNHSVIDNGSSSFTLHSLDIPSFDGTIYDIKSYNTNQHTPSQKFHETDENRSDAALLLGTAYSSSCCCCSTTSSSSSTGYYSRIESIEIQIHKNRISTNTNQERMMIMKRNNSTTDCPTRRTCLYSYYRVHVDLVITLSLPFLEIDRHETENLLNQSSLSSSSSTNDLLSNTIEQQQHDPSLNHNNDMQTKTIIHGSSLVDSITTTTRPSNISSHPLKRKRSSRNSEFLPSVVQLLFTLLQSNWDALKTIQKNRQLDDDEYDNCLTPFKTSDLSNISLFPTHLSLTQIYNRIQYRRQLQQEHKQQSTTSTNMMISSHSFHVMGLPDDILLHGVAPYLNAKSLHAFRCTCKHVYTILQSIVPGLKLHLYPHQVETLAWMQRQESYKTTTTVVHDTYDDSFYQAIHGGNQIRVRSRRNNNKLSCWIIDCTTGKILQRPYGKNVFRSNKKENNNGVTPVCGGFCCDAPGTGKTITILSLILRSIGQISTTQVYGDSERMLEDELFKTYWKEILAHDMKTSALLEFMKDLRQMDEIRILLNTFEILHRFSDIWLRVPQGYYHDDFDLLINEIMECLRYLPKATSESHVDISHLSQRFADIVHTFKSLCLKRSFKRQNNNMTLLMGQKSISNQFSRLHSSKGTLIIVPKALITHWVNQIKMHVQHSYFCESKIPIIFRHKKARKTKLNSSSPIENVFHECIGDIDFFDYLTSLGSHQAFLFVDEDPTLPLPSSAFLANFLIVLSSSQRLSNERKNGNLPVDDEDAELSNRLCPFLNILWLRLVVDEGHTAGNMSTNSSEMCCRISAERRWCVTGTPTPETKTNDGLKNILGLLNFIKYDFFNPQQKESSERWTYLIKSFRKGNVVAFFRLQIMLQGFMARQSKEGIINLCRPELRNVLIDMSPNEITSYNMLVSAVQGNILITTMEGKTSGYQDCLLNPLMSTHAQKAMNNIRLACFGGAHITPVIKERDIARVLGLLRDIHNVDDVKLRSIHDLIRGMSTDHASSCMRCSLNLQTFLLLPCACYLCTECMTNKMTSCPVCCQTFDIDDFQRLQPGIDYNWSWSGEMSKGEERCSARIINDEEHHCNFLNESSCSLCNSICSSCPNDETKASYVIEKILSLRRLSDTLQSLSYLTSEYKDSNRNRPLKIIIFSQFRQMLNIIGDRLIRRLGSHCVAEFWGSTKHHELQRFTCVNDCICLLLGKDGAHGLDLSFVTNIIFLDHIMDESVRNQVISRAYRLGASGSVIVEQLVARGTVEELIGNFNGSQSTTDDTSEHEKNAKKGTGQLRYLLQNVTLIRSADVPIVKKEEPEPKKPSAKSVKFAIGT